MIEPKRRILVSPLNWGLGHASRCIPLVRALIEDDFEPVLAGDGESLDLLSAEFPSLRTYQLPAYGVRYSKDRNFFKLSLLAQAPAIYKAVSEEYEITRGIVRKEKPQGIISDNRFGVRSEAVPSVYMTHQLQIKAGRMSGLATNWHHGVISKFDRCWVCDYRGAESLAGDLSSDPGNLENVEWIGPLSRFTYGGKQVKEIDVSVILSGPEPARSLFQERVMDELKDSKHRVVLVEGRISSSQSKSKEHNITVYNYMLSEELESLINRSRLVVSRSGYSSIMDLQALGARALLVPTPGQTEQEYLAMHLEANGICPTVSQEMFSRDSLSLAEKHPGFKTKKTPKNGSLTPFFGVFKSNS